MLSHQDDRHFNEFTLCNPENGAVSFLFPPAVQHPCRNKKQHACPSYCIWQYWTDWLDLNYQIWINGLLDLALSVLHFSNELFSILVKEPLFVSIWDKDKKMLLALLYNKRPTEQYCWQNLPKIGFTTVRVKQMPLDNMKEIKYIASKHVCRTNCTLMV